MKNIFAKPSAATLALHELEEAHRELLRSESASEFAQQMVMYHEGRIARLEARVVRLGVLPEPVNLGLIGDKTVVHMARV